MRAWAWLRNMVSLRSLSGIRPLKLSTKPFCIWTCTAFVSLPVLVQATFRSKATGLSSRVLSGAVVDCRTH